MPTQRKTKIFDIPHEDLVLELALEINLDRKDGPEDAPLIIEEVSALTRNLGVTVVWDKWKSISKETRSGIIINAYRRARNVREGMPMWPPISLALGLTRTEGKRLGLA